MIKHKPQKLIAKYEKSCNIGLQVGEKNVMNI
jgi:hypothetical protein